MTARKPESRHRLPINAGWIIEDVRRGPQCLLLTQAGYPLIVRVNIVARYVPPSGVEVMPLNGIGIAGQHRDAPTGPAWPAGAFAFVSGGSMRRF